MSTKDPASQYRLQFDDPSEAAEYHSSITASRSLRAAFNWEYLTSRIIAMLERRAVRLLLADTANPRVVVDAPCGAGKLAGVLRGGPCYVGVDSSAAMLSLFEGSPNGDLVRASIQSLPLRNESADLVSCLRYLHRLPAATRAEVLLELRRVSRRFAILYFSVDGKGQQAVLAVERLLNPNARGIQFRSCPDDVRNELNRTHWRIIRERDVLGRLSSGRLFLVEKS